MTGASTRPQAQAATMESGDYRVGIDLGGTKIAAGLVDTQSGAMTHSRRRPTPVSEGADAIIRDVAEIAAEIITLAKAEGRFPSRLELPCPNWSISRAGSAVTGISRSRPLARRSKSCSAFRRWPTAMRAAAHAEARFGTGRSYQSFVYVSLGTGMSYSLVINGRPWAGANGFAIHFASSELALPKEDDSGLTIANAEDFASGKGMQRSFARRAGEPLEDGVRTLEAMSTEGDAPQHPHSRRSGGGNRPAAGADGQHDRSGGRRSRRRARLLDRSLP